MTFLVKNQTKKCHVFLGAFIWNHPEAGPTRPTVTKFAGRETRDLAPTTQKIRS